MFCFFIPYLVRLRLLNEAAYCDNYYWLKLINEVLRVIQLQYFFVLLTFVAIQNSSVFLVSFLHCGVFFCIFFYLNFAILPVIIQRWGSTQSELKARLISKLLLCINLTTFFTNKSRARVHFPINQEINEDLFSNPLHTHYNQVNLITALLRTVQ